MVKRALFILSVGLCAVATGADYVWVGGEGGSWSDKNNWNPAAVPGNYHNVIFTNTVTFSSGNIGNQYLNIYLTNDTAVLHLHAGGLHQAKNIYLKNGGALHLWEKDCLTMPFSDGRIDCDKYSSIICHGENAIPQYFWRFNMTGTLDLGGYNQAITNLQYFAYDPYADRHEQTVTSATPALLTIGGRIQDSNFAGCFKGAAGLCWNPSNSSRTIKFYDLESTTTGDLIVSNGVVNMNTGWSRAYFLHLSRAVIGPTATLSMPAYASVFYFHAEHLVVHDGANLVLGQDATTRTSTVERVTFVDGTGVATEFPAGVYGASSGYAWLTGDCFLSVKPTLSYWKAPQDGTWGTAANWCAGVPSSELGAGLKEPGGDYTVTVGEPAVVTNLTICNWGGGTATLNVASRLGSTKGIWNVGRGGRLVVPEGGEVVYQGTNVNVAAAFAKDTEAFKISDGGMAEVRGRLAITNMHGSVVIGDVGDSVTSKVVIAGNGEMLYKPVNSYFKMSPAGRIEAKDYGTLQILGGGWSQNGGSLDFSGHSKLYAAIWDVCLGQGDAVFREDAMLVGNANARLRFSAATGAATDVRFLDRAAYQVTGTDARLELYPSAGGRIKLRFDSAATHSVGYLKMGMASYNGFVDLYISDGVLKADNASGFNQGGASTYCNANSFSTGHVYQTGGAFVVNGGAYNTTLVSGFVLGDGFTSATVRTPTVLGVYELSGGVVTNESVRSPFVLGVGRGRGEFIQTGGEFVSKATDNGWAPAIFGFSNGYGYYVLSNGTAKISSKIWVGGVSPETCHKTHASYVGTEAVGRITVAAADRTKPCSFTASDTVVLGGLGEGTLEVGPGGTFAGTDLVLSNSTASVLRLVADDSGFGAVRLSGRLEVTDGASLVVDATGFTGANERRCTLLSCASVSGSFAPGKVTVLTDKPTEVKVSVTARGVVLRKAVGALIIVY